MFSPRSSYASRALRFLHCWIWGCLGQSCTLTASCKQCWCHFSALGPSKSFGPGSIRVKVINAINAPSSDAAPIPKAAVKATLDLQATAGDTFCYIVSKVTLGSEWLSYVLMRHGSCCFLLFLVTSAQSCQSLARRISCAMKDSESAQPKPARTH